MQFIDLSVVVNENTPVYPGDPATKIVPAGVFEKDGWNDHYISLGTHVGTHIDAPFHVIDGGKNLDQFPIENFVGPGKLIKVENKTFDFEKVKQADIQAGDIVLFHTGQGDLYHEAEYLTDYPDMPEEIANYLVAKKIKIVGMDMISPDHPPFNTHKILLGGGVLIIENLTNLAKLNGKKFRVYALPIKLQLDAAPARVIAQIKE